MHKKSPFWFFVCYFQKGDFIFNSYNPFTKSNGKQVVPFVDVRELLFLLHATCHKWTS